MVYIYLTSSRSPIIDGEASDLEIEHIVEDFKTLTEYNIRVPYPVLCEI